MSSENSENCDCLITALKEREREKPFLVLEECRQSIEDCCLYNYDNKNYFWLHFYLLSCEPKKWDVHSISAFGFCGFYALLKFLYGQMSLIKLRETSCYLTNLWLNATLHLVRWSVAFISEERKTKMMISEQEGKLLKFQCHNALWWTAIILDYYSKLQPMRRHHPLCTLCARTSLYDDRLSSAIRGIFRPLK